MRLFVKFLLLITTTSVLIIGSFSCAIFRPKKEFHAYDLIKDDADADSMGYWNYLFVYKQRFSNPLYRPADLLLKSSRQEHNVYISSCPNNGMAITGRWKYKADTLCLQPKIAYNVEAGKYLFLSLDTLIEIREDISERFILKNDSLINISDTARVRRALERLPWKPTCLGSNSYKFRK